MPFGFTESRFATLMLNVREGDPSPLSIKALSARSPPRPSPRHSTRLAPLSMIRAETARPSTTSAAVRGGGRLYMESPVDGYSEQEMIREAQLRIEHNKQRLRLKQLLSTAAEGGPTVKTQDLVLACQLAKMPVSPEKVLTTPFAAVRLAPRARPFSGPSMRSRILFPRLAHAYRS